MISLRALEPEDLSLLYAWENNADNWSFGNTVAPYSRQALHEYMQHADLELYSSRQLRLIIVENKNGKAVGSMDLFEFDPFHMRGGLGILIAEPEKRRQGLASEALKVFIDYCFNFLQIRLLYCTISVNNVASIQLFKSLGFEECGNFKYWLAVGNKREDAVFLILHNK